MRSKMVLVILSFLCLSEITSAQVIKLDLKVDGRQKIELGPYVDSEKGRGYELTRYRDQKGRTILKVLEPEGAIVTVYRRGKVVFEDDIPTMVGLKEGFYRVEVGFRKGRADWGKKLEVRDGMVNLLKVDIEKRKSWKDHRREYRDRKKKRKKRRRVISSSAYRRLVASVENESFSDNKIGVIRVAAKNNFFTAEQARGLVALLSFDGDRLKAAKILYRRVVDQENIHILLDAFNFSSTKEEFMSWIEEQPEQDRDYYREREEQRHKLKPIDDNEFGDLYDAMEMAITDRERISIVKGTLEDSQISTFQAILILDLFDSDKYRYQAALFIFDRLTDRDRADRLLDSFEYDTYRNRFRRWLRKQR